METKSIFSEKYRVNDDKILIEQALDGSSAALEKLVKRHQDYIYNIAMKMVLSPFDAADITQEVLIKVLTKLSQFKGKSNFRTWLYRITFNHFLEMKKYWLEKEITSFDQYGDQLDQIPNTELSEDEKTSYRELISEAKFSCMAGMLLCLNREQRLVYILGEIFEADHTIGAELLNITKANFRKRLERARSDLYQFMNNKCGLINKNNPCRCARKTKGFIEAGWVDPNKMKYNTSYVKTITQKIEKKNQALSGLIEVDYQQLFQQHPFQEKDHSRALMKNILADEKVRKVFDLN